LGKGKRHLVNAALLLMPDPALALPRI